MNEKFNLTLVESTRETSHLGSNARVRGVPAKIGEDFGFQNHVEWTIRFGNKLPKQIHKILIIYEDGMTFGPFLGFKADENERGFTVTSLSKNSFSMSFSRR